MNYYVAIEVANTTTDEEICFIVEEIERNIDEKIELERIIKSDYSSFCTYMYKLQGENRWTLLVNTMFGLEEDLLENDMGLRSISYVMESEEHNTEYFAGYKAWLIYEDTCYDKMVYDRYDVFNMLFDKDMNTIGDYTSIRKQGSEYVIQDGFTILETPMYADLLEYKFSDGDIIDLSIFEEEQTMNECFYIDRTCREKGIMFIPRISIIKR